MMSRALCALVALAVACLSAAAPAAAFAADTIPIPLTVENTVTGDTPTATEDFIFVLEAETADAPMPSVNEVSISGSGSASFGNIDFTQAGQYQYKLSERAGTTEGYAYDTTVYQVLVDVSWQNGALVTQVVAWKGDARSDETKVAALAFENTYSAGGNDAGDADPSSPTSDTAAPVQQGASGTDKELTKTGDDALAVAPIFLIAAGLVGLGLIFRKKPIYPSS